MEQGRKMLKLIFCVCVCVCAFIEHVLTAKGGIQKEVVYFGLPKQEVALLQRQAGENKTSLNYNPMLCCCCDV